MSRGTRSAAAEWVCDLGGSSPLTLRSDLSADRRFIGSADEQKKDRKSGLKAVWGYYDPPYCSVLTAHFLTIAVKTAQIMPTITIIPKVCCVKRFAINSVIIFSLFIDFFFTRSFQYVVCRYVKIFSNSY